MPVSIGGGGGLETKAVLATLIVVNAIWLFCFIFAIIHTAIIKRKWTGKYHYGEDLFDREYLGIASFLCGGINIILLLISLGRWVYSLL